MSEIVTGLDLAKGPDTTAWMLRINRAEAERMDADGSLRRFLEGCGLNTRTMTCREDGAELVYEGAAVTKADELTEANLGAKINHETGEP